MTSSHSPPLFPIFLFFSPHSKRLPSSPHPLFFPFSSPQSGRLLLILLPLCPPLSHDKRSTSPLTLCLPEGTREKGLGGVRKGAVREGDE
ncbi:hypothetical protein E2C01_074899 [Portunus trituberculatus]|uniref:Uncharacterized protein n=1 Tax=Portunus trituberculatus TaxID=210409 RepID=A0A5B7I976_PORTR|nr:hypothetical protein [Portunus trituberculatus]